MSCLAAEKMKGSAVILKDNAFKLGGGEHKKKKKSSSAGHAAWMQFLLCSVEFVSVCRQTPTHGAGLGAKEPISQLMYHTGCSIKRLHRKALLL